MTAPFSIGGCEVAPGTSQTVRLPIARRYTADDVQLPVRVIHGKKPGPCIFVTAALHGDEINGVEIVHRLVHSRRMRRLRGTVLAVPVVNVYGFLQQTRYLPDRRDLNRCFPGSERGSLAARLAYVLRTEVVERCSVGIDLHTGSLHRSNLPQIRGQLDDVETLRLARAFRAPVLLSSALREGSLRAMGADSGTRILVYEAGQALRFDELAIRAGVRGVLAVMSALEMFPPRKKPEVHEKRTFVANGSTWVRAPSSGIVRSSSPLGKSVRVGEILATVSDPLGDDPVEVPSPCDGIVVGAVQLPLVNEGDALYHIAHFTRLAAVSSKIGDLAEDLADTDFSPEPSDEMDA